MSVVTRFAPSPTGDLHIGGARTALFNWLYARRWEGVFRLRIEDTDRVRSTDRSTRAIFEALEWLGIEWDGEPVFQSSRARRHREVAGALLERGGAYRCYLTAGELRQARKEADDEGRVFRYEGTWRDRDPSEAPPDVAPSIRLRAPRDGQTRILDHVQGEVAIPNGQLDDMVLLRSDGTPTYMLSVVVDDHDMGITHVIRGDEHLVNAARQIQIYEALGWTAPGFAHIPLIHGADGARLAKRHGAAGVDHYRDAGYLAEAVTNYLLRLGWSHGNEEVIPMNRAVCWFDLPGVGRSPARFDLGKLTSLNQRYLRIADDERLAGLCAGQIARALGRDLAPGESARLAAAMPVLKQRARTVVELAKSAHFLFHERPVAVDDRAAGVLDDGNLLRLGELAETLAAIGCWDEAPLEQCVRAFAADNGIKLGEIAQPLRAALTGSTVSPPLFHVLVLLGREESLGRLDDILGAAKRHPPLRRKGDSG